VVALPPAGAGGEARDRGIDQRGGAAGHPPRGRGLPPVPPDLEEVTDRAAHPEEAQSPEGPLDGRDRAPPADPAPRRGVVPRATTGEDSGRVPPPGRDGLLLPLTGRVPPAAPGPGRSNPAFEERAPIPLAGATAVSTGTGHLSHRGRGEQPLDPGDPDRGESEPRPTGLDAPARQIPQPCGMPRRGSPEARRGGRGVHHPPGGGACPRPGGHLPEPREEEARQTIPGHRTEGPAGAEPSALSGDAHVRAQHHSWPRY